MPDLKDTNEVADLKDMISVATLEERRGAEAARVADVKDENTGAAFGDK